MILRYCNNYNTIFRLKVSRHLCTNIVKTKCQSYAAMLGNGVKNDATIIQHEIQKEFPKYDQNQPNNSIRNWRVPGIQEARRGSNGTVPNSGASNLGSLLSNWPQTLKLQGPKTLDPINSTINSKTPKLQSFRMPKPQDSKIPWASKRAHARRRAED